MNAQIITATAPPHPARPATEPAWLARGEQLREQEWDMAQKLLAAARALLRRLQLRPEFQGSPAEIARMLDLASKLGRLATGLATDHTELSGPAGAPISIDIALALDKVYGQEKEEGISNKAEGKRLTAPSH